jgi:deoxyadenosine/deoxycytidine kinase
MHYNYIAIEGCIGAGKSTLCGMLSDSFGAKPVFEKFDDNAFLPKFYEDPEKYAFPLEMSFLAERFHQLKKISNLDLFASSTISDYIINKCLIFAKINLPEEEYLLYQSFFNITINQLPKPDVLVYLYQDVNRLLHNIQIRGRSYEQSIKREYLENLHKGYMHLIEQSSFQRILILDVNKIDFVNNNDHFQKIKSIIFSPHNEGISRIIVE